LRPSFSASSTSPWTKRRPRLTWVSEGKDFRRLRVMLKAGEVFEIAMLAHGVPPEVQNAAGFRRGPTRTCPYQKLAFGDVIVGRQVPRRVLQW
jgi:hypothetical protein